MMACQCLMLPCLCCMLVIYYECARPDTACSTLSDLQYEAMPGWFPGTGVSSHRIEQRVIAAQYAGASYDAIRDLLRKSLAEGVSLKRLTPALKVLESWHQKCDTHLQAAVGRGKVEEILSEASKPCVSASQRQAAQLRIREIKALEWEEKKEEWLVIFLSAPPAVFMPLFTLSLSSLLYFVWRALGYMLGWLNLLWHRWCHGWLHGSLADQELCSICYSSQRTHAFECGHRCSCGMCATRIVPGPCPICRKHSREAIRIFL